MVSIQALVFGIFKVCILGLIFWLLWFLVDYIGLPEPFGKFARVLLMIVAVFILIAILLALLGHPIVAW